MVQRFDYLVIGSGIAGMSFALKVANEGKSVALICKAGQEEANTYFAQGGIASVTNLKVDNFEKHIEDTMIAGDWISDRAAVEKVVREAPAQIEALIRWGVNFDKKESGEFDLHKEGGHSEFRILHHADNTGAEIQTSLIETVNNHPNITVFTNHYAVEIITQHHMGIIVTRHTPGIKCFGAYVLNEDTGEVHTFLSKITVMATGGCEAVYRNTTNPLVAEWQSRPLEKTYSFVFMDAIHYKVREDKQVVIKAAYVVIGVNLDGEKEVLGIWIGANESSKFWLSVLNDLKNRGVQNVLIFCVDGLNGFKEAIGATFPFAKIQRCIIHQIRSSMKYIPYKDRKAFVADLKGVYTAVNEEIAMDNLLAMKDR